MHMMKTLLLSKSDVESLLTMKDALESVRQSYMAYNQNKVTQPPIMSIDVPHHNGEVDIKASYSYQDEVICVKAAVGFWDNPKRYQLPTGLAFITLYDARNGLPLCIMDGTHITRYRTGAAGGISAQVLARPDSRIVGVIGAGEQARMQVMALKEVLPIELIKVWSRSEEQSGHYKQEMEGLLGVTVLTCDTPEEAVNSADMVVTTTPSKEPIVRDEWIQPGTHIIAIGADMEGKQEIEARIFARAKVAVDHLTECMKRGETQNPIRSNLIQKSNIHAELGEILLGRKAGRVRHDEITLFDSTGMSIQDSTMACMIYKKATEMGIGSQFPFI
ncbi:ornithine cyclodeaminase family protein [Aneurinibacillus migulanus]|uniref:ornithine cyclodeaminase family protein n=1 Tax=Aneurinibacillus migulanus TaxID=47500 RepID=UPI002E2016A2|nr:ornithine cyclodeaminase family protein [Aneurinibacillus migulanus]